MKFYSLSEKKTYSIKIQTKIRFKTQAEGDLNNKNNERE